AAAATSGRRRALTVSAEPADDLPRAADDRVGDGLALAFVLADGVGVGVADGGGVGVGVGVAELALFGATRITWRNRSRAVVPTRLTTCCALLFGTETLMRLLPCGTTVAPLKPAPLTRLFMIESAVPMAVGLGGFPPGVTACRVTVVPLERSRPR